MHVRRLRITVVNVLYHIIATLFNPSCPCVYSILCQAAFYVRFVKDLWREVWNAGAQSHIGWHTSFSWLTIKVYMEYTVGFVVYINNIRNAITY